MLVGHLRCGGVIIIQTKIDEYIGIFSDIFKYIDKQAVKKQVVVNEYILYQHEFFLKIYRHFLSIIMLRKGCNIADEKHPILIKDFSAIIIIMRSILESYLVYYFIYIDKSDKSESQVRFKCWIREGLITRQQFTPFTKNSIIKITKEKIEIDNLQTELLKTEYIKRMNTKELNDFIKKGKWKPGWKNILLRTSIKNSTKEYVYSYLSSHAHSEYMNLMQVSQMHNNNDTDSLIETQLFIFFEVISCFLFDYINQSDIKISIKEQYYNFLNDFKNICNTV